MVLDGEDQNHDQEQDQGQGQDQDQEQDQDKDEDQHLVREAVPPEAVSASLDRQVGTGGGGGGSSKIQLDEDCSSGEVSDNESDESNCKNRMKVVQQTREEMEDLKANKAEAKAAKAEARGAQTKPKAKPKAKPEATPKVKTKAYNRGPFSADEVQRLELGIERHGLGNWKNIGLVVGTRSGQQCRDHSRSASFKKRGKSEEVATPGTVSSSSAPITS